MGIITKATTAQYLNALGLARRCVPSIPQDGQRVYQIDQCLAPTDEYVTAISKAFWDVRPTLAGELHGSVMAKFHDEHCKIRLVWESDVPQCIRPKATGGYIVLHGELMGLWSEVRGRGNWLLDHAIADGATVLSCFDIPHLLKLYRGRGFSDVRREANTKGPGFPDVIWMERNET